LGFPDKIGRGSGTEGAVQGRELADLRRIGVPEDQSDAALRQFTKRRRDLVSMSAREDDAHDHETEDRKRDWWTKRRGFLWWWVVGFYNAASELSTL
ncbi:hypothetical protein ACUX4R_28250, partial [Salmonella enterica]